MKQKTVIKFFILITISAIGYFGLRPTTPSLDEDTGNNPAWFDHYLELKGDENGKIPNGLYGQWYAADKQNKLLNKKSEENLENIKEIGPDNVGGRTRSVLVDRFNSNRYLCAGVSGGVWLSEDKGASWNALDDFAPTLAATCITQSPFDKNLFYYGTGESVGNTAAIGGLGVFRSTDAAASFQHLEHTSTSSLEGIWDIEHSLTKDSTIYVATNRGGLWRSVNAGDTFTRIYSTARAINEIEVFDDGTIMIAVYGLGIVKIDEQTLQPTVMNGGEWPGSGYSRISFDYCKDYPQILFAQLASSDRVNIQGIYKSSNGGETWKEVAFPSIGNYAQAWYDFKLTVAPADTNFVISTAVSPIYSVNGGSSWKRMINPHSDYHELTWIDNDQFLIGNDGGVYRMNKQQMSTYTTLNNGLNITQFYAGHFYPNDNSFIGGTQDNGTRLSNNSATSFGRILGGDGAFCSVHQQDDKVRYTSSQFLNMYRQEFGSQYISNYIRSRVGGNEGVWFINPFEININDGDQLYVPTRRATYRSIDRGNTWIALTNDLWGDTYSVGLSNDVNPIAYIGGTASRLYRVENAALTSGGKEISMWTVKYPNFLGSTIGCIEVDPNDAGTIYCGLTNIKNKSRIWKIENANTDNPVWHDIGAGLPLSLPVNWIEVDPDMSEHILAATDFGLYTSLNGGASWNKEDRFPNVAIDQIRLRPSDRKLFIYTHGRGIWTADLKSNLVASVKETTSSSIHIYPNPTSDFIHIDTPFETCSVFNTSGMEVLSSTSNDLNLGQLPAGTYFVEIKNKGTKSVEKVLVSH